MWAIPEGAPRTPPLRHAGDHVQIEFNGDGTLLAVATGQEARLWSMVSGARLLDGSWPHNPVGKSSFSSDGTRSFTSFPDGTILTCDLKSEKVSRMKLPTSIEKAKLNPRGDQVLVVNGPKARIWSLATAMPLTPEFIEDNPITFMEFSPNGTLVVTGTGRDYLLGATGRDYVSAALGHARVWDAATGKSLFPPFMQQTNIGGAVLAAFSSDGQLLVTGVREASLGQQPPIDTEVARIWDLRSGHPISPPILHQGQLQSLAFSPDSQRVLTSSYDQTVRVWDRFGTPIIPPIKHSKASPIAIWSPDSKRVATACDRAIRVWDAASGNALTPPMVHTAEINRFAFSPDGRLILCVTTHDPFRGGGGSLYLWDSFTGDFISTPLPNEPFIRDAQFTPDGQKLLVQTDERALKLWELPVEKRPVSDLVSMAQLLSNRQLDIAGGEVPLSLKPPTKLEKTVNDLRANWPAAAGVIAAVMLPPDKPAALWKNLRSKYPQEFALASPADVKEWHHQTALRNETDREWFGALFHYGRLARLNPEDV